MIYGGFKKFEKPMPSPTELIEKIKSGESIAPNDEVLKIKNYIFGMKQTGFFWEFLGILEIFSGLLLISLVCSRIGAIITLPITINIFLFHLFLEPNDTADLLQTLGLLIINIILIGLSYKIWKPLLLDKSILKFR